MSNEQFAPASDLETIKSVLESADIDFEEYRDEEKDTTHVEISNGIVFSFNDEEELLGVG